MLTSNVSRADGEDSHEVDEVDDIVVVAVVNDAFGVGVANDNDNGDDRKGWCSERAIAVLEEPSQSQLSPTPPT